MKLHVISSIDEPNIFHCKFFLDEQKAYEYLQNNQIISLHTKLLHLHSVPLSGEISENPKDIFILKDKRDSAHYKENIIEHVKGTKNIVGYYTSFEQATQEGNNIPLVHGKNYTTVEIFPLEDFQAVKQLKIK